MSVFHLEQDREEQKKVDEGDEHAKAHQRKKRLKAKLRKAGGMAGLLKTSTHALAEGGKGLIKKKSYLAETMFDALSGDERAWVGASLLLADCLEDVDIRALPCVSPAVRSLVASPTHGAAPGRPWPCRRPAIGPRAALDRAHVLGPGQGLAASPPAKAIQKASRTIKGMRDTYALGAASTAVQARLGGTGTLGRGVPRRVLPPAPAEVRGPGAVRRVRRPAARRGHRGGAAEPRVFRRFSVSADAVPRGHDRAHGADAEA